VYELKRDMPVAEVINHDAYLLIKERKREKFEYYFASLIKTLMCVNSTSKSSKLRNTPLDDFLISFNSEKKRPTTKELVTKLKYWASDHNQRIKEKEDKACPK